jgi:hypothetical protein
MNSTKEFAWVSSQVLDWEILREDSEGLIGWKRAYKHWDHAEQILSKPENEINELYLVDVITTLKRAINHRVQHLNESYGFKKIPVEDISRHLFEQLSYFGIVKPRMLKNLVDIRNAVEHQDVSPPSYERCLEFLEFVWYFLRSTDVLAAHRVSLFVFEYYEKNLEYGLEIETKPDSDWKIKIHGYIPPSMYSPTRIDTWICLEINEKKTIEEQILRILDQEESDQEEIEEIHEAIEEIHKTKNPEDIYIDGIMIGPLSCIKRLFHQYFAMP